ncbi:MAG: Alkylhydroperoxidase AhpD core [Massilia sp.]|nr:Alkylhydroperoxidase AhpD core [Massilia sp.]
MMPRIPTVTGADTPENSKPMLGAVAAQFGKAPNMLRTLAHSPAALRFYLGQVQALADGELSAQLREQIALATAGISHCDYCASAHTLAGKGHGLDAAELADNLAGRSHDGTVQAALDFARQIVTQRGHVDEDAVDRVRRAGYSEAEIVEIIAHVGMNLFTNYFNHIAATVIDFPLVRTGTAAAF